MNLLQILPDSISLSPKERMPEKESPDDSKRSSWDDLQVPDSLKNRMDNQASIIVVLLLIPLWAGFLLYTLYSGILVESFFNVFLPSYFNGQLAGIFLPLWIIFPILFTLHTHMEAYDPNQFKQSFFMIILIVGLETGFLLTIIYKPFYLSIYEFSDLIEDLFYLSDRLILFYGRTKSMFISIFYVVILFYRYEIHIYQQVMRLVICPIGDFFSWYADEMIKDFQKRSKKD